LRLAVFIPAYNAAEFIGEAVASVLAHGRIVTEIVIVNDGSTDETARACGRLVRRHSHIRYAEQPENRGGGATRNTAVGLTTAEYLFNLDADNILTPELLPRLVRRAEEHRANHGGHAIVTPETLQFFRDEPRRLRLGKRRVLTRAWQFERLNREHLLTHPNTPIASGNYLFHRSIFETAGGYFETHGPYDAWSFGARCVLAGFPVVAVPRTSYLHRVTGVSYWQRNADSGANREYLFRAIRDLGCYDAESVRSLVPSRPDYPADPFASLRLAAGAVRPHT
jgi:glycosyltransferase involved in cell wall biosynthesis